MVAPEDTLGEVAERMVQLGRRARRWSPSTAASSGSSQRSDLLRALAGRVHSSEARVRPWMTAEPIAVTATTSLEAAPP